MMTPEFAVAASILLCAAGALVVIPIARFRTFAGWFAFLVTAASAALIFSAAAFVLTQGASVHPESFFGLRIHVDGLTAVFLMLAAFIAIPASWYSITYMRHYADYGVGRYYANFLLFLGGMYGILSITDMMWYFFLFWQMMTLSSYMLIRFEHKKPENIRAANKYLVMMQIACIAAMVGAGLLASGSGVAGKYEIDTISAGIPAIMMSHPGTVMLAFALFLIGFGIKMGMWPFGQIWLPDAHPAAPSPVSALLSGVMIKTGVYGLLRSFLWLVPAGTTQFPLENWGMVVAILGTITLFTGTMQALRQEQSKRLLAFHSIGQIGYILLGTGVCMALLQNGNPDIVALGTIGFFGAVYHVLNHGVFKGLLFLNAGSLLYATDTQDLNKMGGLMKLMPLTAITTIVASFSISGVPLFNGFVSKWSIYVAAVLGSGAAKYLVICAVIAILTSALTLASFIKFFGVSFLSRPSSLVIAQAEKKGRLEVSAMMQLPQVFLAMTCIVMGMLPAVVFQLLQSVVDASRHGYGIVLANTSPMAGGVFSGVQGFQANAIFAPFVLLILIGLMFLITIGITKLGGATRREVAPWLCGYAQEADCHRYTAHNFYTEIKRYFRWLGGSAHAGAEKRDSMKGH
ncbi:MAG: proton-conducting transporter membrane subunit [Nitrospirota bacterium]